MDQRSERSPGRVIALGHAGALAGAVALALLTAGSARWSVWLLVVIVLFAVGSDLTSVETGSTKLKLSGSFLGIMLAAVLLGGGPAALVGTMSIAVGWFRSREAGHYLRNNLAAYAWFSLLGGLFFHAAVSIAHVGPGALGYYLLVFATFVLALAMNFLLVAGYQCCLDASSLVEKTREALVPVLAAELFSALLTLGAVYTSFHAGTVGLALFALVLVVFQYLVGELLLSRQRSNELHRVATTDALTGMANRARFLTRLDHEIVSAGLAGEPFAVLLMDLDRFKEINDTLGHHYGDMLLRETGPRLAACVGPEGLVARLGGDEFAVLPGLRTHDPKILEELAGRLVASVQEPFAMDELALEVGASVGIARFPLDGRDEQALLRAADVAMYAAKTTQNDCKLYAAELDHNSVRRLRVRSDFRRALDTGEVVVHYQPKVQIYDRRVTGAEALVRWQHPEHGLLPPAAFVPAVEQTALLPPLTRHVLERSIWQCAAWRHAGHDISVAVNLSVGNLLDRDLPRDIERMLDTHGLPAQALELEITESMIMTDSDRAMPIVTRLSALGVRLAVDDFGTGYASLASLTRLPIDELKIDRSFVTPMLQNESDLIIVRSTINLAHDLGLKVVAEGIEDEPTLQRLALFGCDVGQGYHLSGALAADAFADWLVKADLERLEPPRLPGHTPSANPDTRSRVPPVLRLQPAN